MEKTRIRDLQSGKGCNVEGEIIKLDATKEVRTKFGKLTRTQKVIVKDDSGTIELQLWEDYCDKFNKGDRIEIKGGWVSEYKGELQLSTGKFGKIERIQIESEPIVPSTLDNPHYNPKTGKYEPREPKTDFVPANQLKSIVPNENQIREWSMKRGGFSHDASSIVAALITSGSIPNNQESIVKAQIEITDSLVKAAEEREVKFRQGGV